MFRDNNGKIKWGWKLLIPFIVYILILFGFAFSLDAVMLFFAKNAASSSIGSMDEYINNLYTKWWIAIVFVQEGITIAVSLFFWKLFENKPIKAMGLDRMKKYGKEAFIGAAFGMVAMTLIFLFLIATGNARVVSWVPVVNMELLWQLCAFIAVGFAEEIFCRGYMMSVMRETKNKIYILLLPAVTFGLLHLLNASFSFVPFLNICLIGILFACMYLWSGNLWMCIGFHITWNYFQGSIYGFPVSGLNKAGMLSTVYDANTIVNGGGFGPEGGLAVTGIILIGILFIKYYYKGKKCNFFALEVEEKLI